LSGKGQDELKFSGNGNECKPLVVGNSGSLLLANHGAEIDGHDAVLRMNNAPVGGRFLAQVGQKTSFNLVNFHW